MSPGDTSVLTFFWTVRGLGAAADLTFTFPFGEPRFWIDSAGGRAVICCLCETYVKITRNVTFG